MEGGERTAGIVKDATLLYGPLCSGRRRRPSCAMITKKDTAVLVPWTQGEKHLLDPRGHQPAEPNGWTRDTELRLRLLLLFPIKNSFGLFKKYTLKITLYYTSCTPRSGRRRRTLTFACKQGHGPTYDRRRQTRTTDECAREAVTVGRHGVGYFYSVRHALAPPTGHDRHNNITIVWGPAAAG